MNDSHQSGSWQPLFAGPEAAAIYQTVDTIATALQPRETEPHLGPQVPFDRAMRAVMYAYLDRELPGRGHLDSAAAALEVAITALDEVDPGLALYGGYPGVGWAVDHLRPRLHIVDSQTNDGIDEMVLDWLRQEPWTEHYDLISGVVGVGVYAVERYPEPGGTVCLQGVIDRLAQSAELLPEGLTWWTRPELLSLRKARPHGVYDLGMAHGVPGVIALLGEAYAAGITRARPLLVEAVRWLLQCRQPEAAGSVFPPSLARDRSASPRPARMAWCYGDLGVAVALLGAARRTGELHWETAALQIARQAAQRPPEQSRVVDAGLCHGAAGLGHLYNRLFQATAEPLFADAARAWLRRALAMHKPNQGIAGYLSYIPLPISHADIEPRLSWQADSSFLTGVSGIALALLGAVSQVAPDWDRLLLTRL